MVLVLSAGRPLHACTEAGLGSVMEYTLVGFPVIRARHRILGAQSIHQFLAVTRNRFTTVLRKATRDEHKTVSKATVCLYKLSIVNIGAVLDALPYFGSDVLETLPRSCD